VFVLNYKFFTLVMMLVVPKFSHTEILTGQWSLLRSIYFVLTSGALLRVKFYAAWAYLQTA